MKQVPMNSIGKGGIAEGLCLSTAPAAALFLLLWDTQGILRRSLNVKQLSDGFQLYFL